MLKAPVLRFTDDIPRAQFWFAYDKLRRSLGKDKGGYSLHFGRVFRVPADFGYYRAYYRARHQLGMLDPALEPASPRMVLEWLAAHPNESKFREAIPANPEEKTV
jgi:hypothetical protein